VYAIIEEKPKPPPPPPKPKVKPEKQENDDTGQYIEIIADPRPDPGTNPNTDNKYETIRPKPDVMTAGNSSTSQYEHLVGGPVNPRSEYEQLAFEAWIANCHAAVTATPIIRAVLLC